MAVIMIGMMCLAALSGCTAALVRNLDPAYRETKRQVENTPSYANTKEAKELSVPEAWKDEAMKDKVLFEGHKVETPDGSAKRIRMMYIDGSRGHVLVVSPGNSRLKPIYSMFWEDWKDNSEEMKGFVLSHDGAMLPVGNTKVAGLSLQKVSPTLVREIFLGGDEPALCRSVMNMDDIPEEARYQLGLPLKGNPVIGVLSLAALALPGVGMAVAPALAGIGAAAAAIGTGAAAVAGQTAVGLAAKSTATNQNVATKEVSDGVSAGLPVCYDFNRKVEQPKW